MLDFGKQSAFKTFLGWIDINLLGYHRLPTMNVHMLMIETTLLILIKKKER